MIQVVLKSKFEGLQLSSVICLLPPVYRSHRRLHATLKAFIQRLIPITLAGLFVTAYLQYRRGDQLDL
ncbi:hypothetical protein MIMGU_mgv11b018160mg [Erythranthe guttata]|uniref:Uncharacterized protein n=1 Tax=Erythranthe guttata TaxID=4155 RepID=A0A022QM92_ERYGU|nr:hypothetical protein MIMGU_mgv11b018160mg [Erythranthe guttata]